MRTARLRVLFVHHVGCLSGAEHSLLALLEALDRERYALRACCPEGPLPRRLAAAGAQVHTLPMARLRRSRDPFYLMAWLRRWRRATARILRVIRTDGADLVHANSTEAFLYAQRAGRRARVPVLWHVRDLVPLSGLGRRLARRAAKVIAISDAVARHLVEEKVPAEKIVRIYNGIDLETHRARAQEEVPDLPGPGPVATLVAQLVPWKRHEDFLRAFQLASRKHPDLWGMLVGSDLFGDHPGYFTRLQSLCRSLGIADRIVFAGQRADVPAILARSALLVHPAEREPFGRVVLEAMALGTPVIAASSGGLPELVADGRTGLLVPVGRPDLLAEAMDRLLADRALARELGARAASAVAERFTARQTAAQVARVYEETARA